MGFQIGIYMPNKNRLSSVTLPLPVFLLSLLLFLDISGFWSAFTFPPKFVLRVSFPLRIGTALTKMIYHNFLIRLIISNVLINIYYPSQIKITPVKTKFPVVDEGKFLPIGVFQLK